MNFGAVAYNPLSANCTRFAELFSTQAPAFHQPGQPDAVGIDTIIATCTVYRGLVNPIIAFQVGMPRRRDTRPSSPWGRGEAGRGGAGPPARLSLSFIGKPAPM